MSFFFCNFPRRLSCEIRGKCLCIETLKLKCVPTREGIGAHDILESDYFLAF